MGYYFLSIAVIWTTYPSSLRNDKWSKPIRLLIMLIVIPACQKCFKSLRFINQVCMSIPFLPLLVLIWGRRHTFSEACDVVFKYIEKDNLVKPTDKSIVVLDPTLCDSLFKGAIKMGTTCPTEIHKKDFGSTFVCRMQAHHVVSRGSESVVREGALKTIKIVTEWQQGNKKMTKLSGLETFLMDDGALASEMQKKFASSTTVAEFGGIKLVDD